MISTYRRNKLLTRSNCNESTAGRDCGNIIRVICKGSLSNGAVPTTATGRFRSPVAVWWSWLKSMARTLNGAKGNKRLQPRNDGWTTWPEAIDSIARIGEIRTPVNAPEKRNRGRVFGQQRKLAKCSAPDSTLVFPIIRPADLAVADSRDARVPLSAAGPLRFKLRKSVPALHKGTCRQLLDAARRRDRWVLAWRLDRRGRLPADLVAALVNC